ncbi:Vesicle transport protein Use1 [Gracilaria domingensis]|nr:Vesicle transport protein Use1 [Gracilaria domingensis]
MTNALIPDAHVGGTNLDMASGRATRRAEKDEVFWTELEIRRLGNVVAESINARRYIGDSNGAEEERKQMRAYIEAMKRKSTRVLHRAELYARSGHAAWPGIDPTITDPVSLAEEYVRVVENYEAVLSEEESRAKLVRAENVADTDSGVIRDLEITAEEWEKADDLAYREALQKDKQRSESARQDLFNDADGLRRRKGAPGSSEVRKGSLSKEDEELLARHQPIQDELTSNLVDLVGQLKESVTNNNEKLKKDSEVLDKTEAAVEKNISGITRHRTNLREYGQSATFSWWLMMIAVVVMVVIFVLLVILMRIPV